MLRKRRKGSHELIMLSSMVIDISYFFQIHWLLLIVKLGRYAQPLSVVFGSSPELVVLSVLMLSYFYP